MFLDTCRSVYFLHQLIESETKRGREGAAGSRTTIQHHVMCRVCIDHYQDHLVIASITPRERWDGRISLAACCRNISAVWNSFESKWLQLQDFSVNCHERLFQLNIRAALHLIMCQGFNKSIIRTVSSLLQSEDPQMACQQTAHSLFTDAYCTQNKKQEPAEIASSDLIGWCYTRLSYLNIWIKIFSLFTMKLISISKTVCLTFYYVCEIICIWMKKKINSKLLHTFLIIASHRSTLLCPCLN